MKDLSYTTRIDCSPQRVWDALTDPDDYCRWAKAFSPNSQFKGEWEQGAFITFFDPDMGGTKAVVEELVPTTRIHVRHVAIVQKDGTDDTESAEARKWLGITESYTLEDADGSTDLLVEIQTHEDYEKMFNQSWPKALALLRVLCESE